MAVKYPIEINLKALLRLFFVPDINSYYSPAYSWFVNQAGHALLGVVFAIALTTGIFSFSSASDIQSWALTLAFSFIVYGIKEFFDVKKLTQQDKAVDTSLKFSRAEVFNDAAADWFFVNIGVLTGASVASSFLTIEHHLFFAVFIILGGLTAMLGFVFIGKHYIVNKLLWQYSKLPFIKDLAHCPVDVLHRHRSHFQQQISTVPSNAHYVGPFGLVHDFLSGLARRRMVHASNRFRRVRYWQAQALIEALHCATTTQTKMTEWSLADADVQLVWVDEQHLPQLTAEQAELLSQSVWFIGSLTAELPEGWAQLAALNVVDLTS